MQQDWNPETYARFRGLRLGPALDLMAQVGPLPTGAVVNLGCGDGAAGAALAARFPGRALVGVDASAAMLAAVVHGPYAALVEADAAVWQPDRPVALIFSNAALQWVPDHDRLMPRLAGLLVPGGVLAVQMPRQTGAPSHRFLRDIAASMFPDRFDGGPTVPEVKRAETYWRMLSAFGEVTAWETDYLQRLEPAADGHPVRLFTQSTAMRPVLDRLTPDEAQAFVHAYEVALGAAYPLLPDGAALFPFRRLFFTLKV